MGVVRSSLFVKTDRVRPSASGLTLSGMVELHYEQRNRTPKEAMAAKHYSAAVRAQELLGKTKGMFIDRSEVDLNAVSDEHLCREIVRKLPSLTEDQRASLFQSFMRDLGREVSRDAYHAAARQPKATLQ
jgi:hypothetical protein